MKKINFSLIAGISCLLIAFAQITLLFEMGLFSGSGGGLYGSEQYILEVAYCITIAYFISNVILGIVTLYYTNKWKFKKTNIAFICGMVYLLLRIYPLFLGDVLTVRLNDYVSQYTAYIITIMINCIPLTFYTLGSIQKFNR
jgi:hypothetical protein